MFALLLEYFRRKNIAAELLSEKCTTKNPRGPRLDGWVKIQKEPEIKPTYYQVEVKLWSAHGVGSGAQILKPEDDIASYKRRLWSTYWNNGKFIEKSLNKVLTPMACPIPDAEIKPLACLWSPLHPHGAEESFFELELEPASPFPALSIFSASSFLRKIKDTEPTLFLNLPEVTERMKWLNNIFAVQ